MDFSQPGVPSIAAVIPGKVPASCMAYHEDGKRLYVASESDAKLQVVNCVEGKADQVPFRIEREQIHVVEATHHEQAILVAGKGSPSQPSGQRHAISYWSLYDNKIMRKFRGHTDKVTAISMCPADDTFLSSSNDGSVRLWNIQQAGCLAELKLPSEATGSPVAVFDATGLVFCAVAAMSEGAGEGGHYVHLYDARNYSGGAFAEFKVQRGDLEKSILSHVSMDVNRAMLLSRSAFRSVQFNVSGSSIMIGTDNGMNVLLDGFEGNIQRIIYDVRNTSSRPAVACFSSDDKTVMCGNDNGSISCWDLASGLVVKQLEGHLGAVNCMAANPKYAQLASACTQTALWLW